MLDSRGICREDCYTREDLVELLQARCSPCPSGAAPLALPFKPCCTLSCPSFARFTISQFSCIAVPSCSTRHQLVEPESWAGGGMSARGCCSHRG